MYVDMNQLRVAAYCRVSTQLTEQQSSMAGQKEHYKTLINSNQDWVFAGIYCPRDYHRDGI